MANTAAVANLIARRDAIAVELATGGATGQWQPTTNTDGELINWQEYRESLVKEMDDVQKLIVKLSGPFLVRSYGRSGGW